jgi:hypothetical protein
LRVDNQYIAGGSFRERRNYLEKIAIAAYRIGASQQLQAHVSEGGGTHYGYGWSIEETPRGKLITHNGGNGIFATDFLRFDADGLVFVITSNRAEVSSIAASQAVRVILDGEHYELPPEVTAMEAEVLDTYAGRYETSSGAQVVVARDGGALSVSSADPELFPLVFEESDRVAARNASSQEKSIGLIEASLMGEYEKIRQAFGGRMDLDEVAGRERELWGSIEDELGPLMDMAPLGVYSDRGTHVIVRLEFERGVRYMRLVWEGPELAGIGMLEAPPARSFLPESPTSFVVLDFRRRSATRVRFELDEASGRPAAIVLDAPGGGLQAKRTQ